VKTFWARERSPARCISITAKHAQFDLLFVASLELILRPACIGVNVHGCRAAMSAAILDRCQERLYADDIHDAREIVGEYVQGHLGRNFR
jgi:hypothetical protein